MSRSTHSLALASLIALGACAGLPEEPPPEQNASHRLERGLAALDAGLYADSFDDLAWVYARCPDRVAGAQALAALAAIELDPRNPAGRPAVGTDLLARFLRDPARPDWAVSLAETSYLMARALGAPAAEDEDVASADGDVIRYDEVADSVAADTTAAADTARAAVDTTAVSADTAGAPPDTAGTPGDTTGVQRDTVAAWPDTAAAADTTAAPADAADARGPRRSAAAERIQRLRAAALPPRTASEPVTGCGAPVQGENRLAPAIPTLPGPSLLTVLASAEAERSAAVMNADSLREQVVTLRQRLRETEAELERIRKTLRP